MNWSVGSSAVALSAQFTQTPREVFGMRLHRSLLGAGLSRRAGEGSPRLFLAAMTLLAVVIVSLALGHPLLRSAAPTERYAADGGLSALKLISYNQSGGLSLRGGTGWINSGPITLEQLKGKIVLLDFWTFCCINCHHVLPDLAKLEDKYKNELVVIGVHTAKFDAEKDTENIRRKVREYRIKHPVINDANQVLWNRFGVSSWPTLLLIDPTGRYVGRVPGEGHYVELDEEIGKLVEIHKANGDLDLTPLKFTPEMDRPSTGPLLFPGKVLADSARNRLFIADTGHNRIVQTDLEGGSAVVIGNGAEGFVDGDYARAQFNRPQGMCLDGETLYVADTENHAIRAVKLKEGKVSTVAGVGTQNARIFAPGNSGRASTTQLCSPWDLIQLSGDKAIYVAMAGPHQIWKLDVEADKITVFAGSGYENIEDGPTGSARFAQPSGLATDGQNIFVADSEVSGIRVITNIQRGNPVVRTIAGRGLFIFGDQDGIGQSVRLQHCLGLAYGNDFLFIADTYNNRIKVCNPQKRAIKVLVGSHTAGDSDKPPKFYEPGGLSFADMHLYVADTNNHKIKVVDIKTEAVKTVALEGLSPPAPSHRRPSFPNAKTIDMAAVEAAAAKSLTLAVSLPLPKGFKLNEEVPLPYVIETPMKTGVLSADVPETGAKISPPATRFKIDVPLAEPAQVGQSIDLRLSLSAFVCNENSSLCQIRSYICNIPVKFTDSGKSEPIAVTIPKSE
jgi:thiol-disulfide isomerase/thioredoxin